MCGGKKSAAPAPVQAPITDMSTSRSSQAAADAAAQRANAAQIVSSTDDQKPASFGAELAAAS